ncbi:MAG: metallophosphoesterase [Candidatus Pacebacteria bacterium]|nr:metallophosphoesterase [Candidatus Paceibacterota bacterium]
MSTDIFSLWVFGDAHVETDLRHGRESLAEALHTSERGGEEGGPPFDWDIAIDVGDMSGGQSVPEDSEGEEVVRQFNALEKHPREAVYNVCGNHDRSGLDEPEAWWWRKWVDPMGKHTECSGVDSRRRPFPVNGTWERYSFRAGNILFLMMSDINEPSQTIGRGDLGGNPAGVVSGETFEWWTSMVESAPDSIIISVHHYMLKETTVASGEWEGLRKDSDGNWKGHYHGFKPQGAPRGASYLYFVGSQPDAQAFENYIEEHPGAVDVWLGGHTHAHPDDTYGGKTHIETKWGTHFINAACLSRYHGSTNVPKSRLFTFAPGSRELRVQCYMHTSEFLPQGWYAKEERILPLTRPFEWQ